MCRSGGDLFSDACLEQRNAKRVQLPVHRHHAHPGSRILHGQPKQVLAGAPLAIVGRSVTSRWVIGMVIEGLFGDCQRPALLPHARRGALLGQEKTSKLAAWALATARTDGFKVDAAWQTTARHSLTGNTA